MTVKQLPGSHAPDGSQYVVLTTGAGFLATGGPSVPPVFHSDFYILGF